MKVLYQGKEIELDDEEVLGRYEFDNNNDDLEDTKEIDINEIGVKDE